FLESGLSGVDAKEQWAQSSDELVREATVAEVFDNLIVSRFYRGLLLGVLVRMIDAELEHARSETLAAMLEEATAMRDTWLAKLEADLDYRVIPIKKLVAVQLGAALHTALHLKQERAVDRTA
ncbi:MAG: hypothetical protein IRZ33_11725, partial [Alicyclobacillaceae bacterium]|nr:hypothetical protein [Alicyclobacillaceae bacterium]